MKLNTVFVAEDSQHVRENLNKIITQAGGLKIIGESSSVKGSIKFADNQSADIFLIDIGLEDGSGIDVLKFIRSKDNSAIIIMFTNYISPPYEIICSKLGADYFLDKTKDLDILMSIFQKMHTVNK